MAEWTAIQAVLGKLLCPRLPGHTETSKAPLDRALRIVRHVDKIAAVLPAEEKPPRCDLVRIAALGICIPLPKQRADEAADDAAEIATDHLGTVLTEEELDLVVKIMRDAERRAPRTAEARLLADAVALEDVGLVGLWNAAGKYQGLGRSLEQFIRLWRTQAEYGYWETRLRDGFHFEVSRGVARQRLADMAAIIGQMETQQNGADVPA